MIFNFYKAEGWARVDPSPLNTGSVYLEVYRPEAGFAKERIDFPLTLRMTGVDREYNQPRTYIRVAIINYDEDKNTYKIEINKQEYIVKTEIVVGVEP